MAGLASYLEKRYGDIDSEKQRRRRKLKQPDEPVVDSRMEIVDVDDLYAVRADTADKDSDEDMPMVVNDAPPDVMLAEEFMTERWKKMSSSNRKRHDSDASSSDGSPTVRHRHDSDDDPPLIGDSNKPSSSKRPVAVKKEGVAPKKLKPKVKRKKIKEEPPSPEPEAPDLSPPRRRSASSPKGASPPPRHSMVKREPRSSSDCVARGIDISPPPLRRIKEEQAEIDSDSSPQRRPELPTTLDDDASPPRRRPTKTSSGATAGLRTAEELRTESAAVRHREKKMFDTLDEDISGRGAETVKREGIKDSIKKYKKKELTQEQIDRNKARENKYALWNRGVKQVQTYIEKKAEVAHEMTKAHARFADDEDMNDMLKGKQYSHEDPMYKYMQKKQKQRSRLPDMPTYAGAPPPENRFTIWPGYRWDGVNRSNGFEDKLLTHKNESAAEKEEFYRWSYAME